MENDISILYNFWRADLEEALSQLFYFFAKFIAEGAIYERRNKKVAGDSLGDAATKLYKVEDMISFMTNRRWIALSGFLWLSVGTLLLYKGLNLIAEGAISSGSLCFRMQGFFGSPQQSGTALIAAGLLVGFVKGRFVLSKTVRKMALRISSLQAPIRFFSVYAPSYWLLIGLMIALGILLKYLPIPVDVRGLIDTAVGSALIQGAILYFRASRGALRI